MQASLEGSTPYISTGKATKRVVDNKIGDSFLGSRTFSCRRSSKAEHSPGTGAGPVRFRSAALKRGEPGLAGPETMARTLPSKQMLAGSIPVTRSIHGGPLPPKLAFRDFSPAAFGGSLRSKNADEADW